MTELGHKREFRSNGKLLVSAEYLVLDGAEALAFPTRLGQTLSVEQKYQSNIVWESYTHDGKVWFKGEFDNDFNVMSSNDANVANTLSIFLKISAMLNPGFIDLAIGTEVKTHLEFDQSWGLGSSSTLISNIAQWAGVDPFVLQQESFPGSGYDIACAFSNKAIVYQITDKEPSYITLGFSPSFKDQIYFVHLNKKQNSREGIKKYREYTGDRKLLIEEVNSITKRLVECEDVNEFRKLMAEHELLISKVIGETPVKQKLFADFRGSVKSLGAWGGDFVMAVGSDVERYFKRKGYNTIITFDEMVLK